MLTLCQRIDLSTSLNSVDKIRAIWRVGGFAFCRFDRRDLGYGRFDCIKAVRDGALQVI